MNKVYIQKVLSAILKWILTIIPPPQDNLIKCWQKFLLLLFLVFILISLVIQEFWLRLSLPIATKVGK